MKKYACVCPFLILPLMGFADSADDRQASTEIADGYSSKTSEWRESDETSPRTNPRWYRNPEAREAYLRGDKDFRGYPRQSDSKTRNQSDYYKRTSNQTNDYKRRSNQISDGYSPSTSATRRGNDALASTNPRWYRNPEARDAYLRGEEDYRNYPRQGSADTGRD